LLSKLVVEAKDNASGDPHQETPKQKPKEANADDPFSSLMGELTKLLEPVEITKREERSMRKMINNYIKRTLTELVAEIGNTKLTDTHEEEPTLRTNESPHVETPEVLPQEQQPAQITQDAAAAFVAEINAKNEIRDLLGSYFTREYLFLNVTMPTSR
jgi:hypothetical protein